MGLINMNNGSLGKEEKWIILFPYIKNTLVRNLITMWNIHSQDSIRCILKKILFSLYSYRYNNTGYCTFKLMLMLV